MSKTPDIAFLSGMSDLMLLYFYLKEYRVTPMSFKETVVYIYGTRKNICDEMLVTARSLFPEIPCNILYCEKNNLSEVLEAFEDLHCSTLYMSHVLGRFENMILDKIKRDKLILIENGIATYFPPSARIQYLNPKSFHDLSEAVLPLSQLGIYPSYLNFHKPTIIVPQRESFLSLAGIHQKHCRPLVDFPEDVSVKIVIGTSLYRLGVIERETEEDLYLAELKLADEGLKFFKGHPRAFASRKLSQPTSNARCLNPHLPVELLAAGLYTKTKVKACSIASSSLLSLKAYGLAEISRIPAKLDSSRHPHLQFMQKIVPTLKNPYLYKIKITSRELP